MYTIAPKTRVKRRSSGRVGTITHPYDGPFSESAEEGEVAVIWDRVDFQEFVNVSDLDVIGIDSAVADLDKCGHGGEHACVFGGIGSDGLECLRYTNLHWMLTFKNMVAKRKPTEPYPDCQLKQTPATATTS